MKLATFIFTHMRVFFFQRIPFVLLMMLVALWSCKKEKKESTAAASEPFTFSDVSSELYILTSYKTAQNFYLGNGVYTNNYYLTMSTCQKSKNFRFYEDGRYVFYENLPGCTSGAINTGCWHITGDTLYLEMCEVYVPPAKYFIEIKNDSILQYRKRSNYAPNYYTDTLLYKRIN